MNEVKKILEALAKHDITVEEAEKLILAVKLSKKNKPKSSRSVVGKEFIINEDEIYDGNIEIVNGNLILRGIVNGKVEAVFSEVEFSGTVNGKFEAVGCNIKWDGGVINGDIEIVGCNYKGKKPKVSGKVKEVNGFFINSLLKIVKFSIKPFMNGIKISE